MARNQTKKRVEVKIYAIDFPPKQLDKKVGIMVEIRKTLKAKEVEFSLDKATGGESLDSVKVGGCEAG